MTNSAINVVEVSAKDSTKITSVSLYSGLAEITRVFKAELKGGDNKVVVSGLPNALILESLRIEGHGPCTIHEVSTSDIPRRVLQRTSPQLASLLREKGRLGRSIARCRTCASSVDKYQQSLNVERTPAEELLGISQGVEVVAADLDERMMRLEDGHAEVEKEIERERERLGEAGEDERLRKRVTVTVVAEEDSEVEFVLIYGVRNATWDAAYDIYVKMDVKDKPIAFTYKGAILQDTGESWDDVSLTLETATPTMGLTIPKLDPWTISEYRPIVQAYKAKKITLTRGAAMAMELTEGDDEDEDMAFGLFDEGPAAPPPPAPLRRRQMLITSKGDINATFVVPGLISIPSDGETHNVTVCELTLDAVMSWVSVPKKDLKGHLTAKIKNDSEFTFLAGVASIYVDGSFISRSSIVSVRPQETFDCPLGVDPTVKITYHPRSKKVNHAGFTRKTCSYIFEQRITVVNTKPTVPLSSIKIQDQIPVSEDDRIVVKLANPPLPTHHAPASNATTSKRGGGGGSQTPATALESVTIKTMEKGCKLSAQWAEMEEVGPGGGSSIDPALVGKSGKVNWICEDLPAQAKIVIVLSWEVVCPYGTDVMGLDT